MPRKAFYRTDDLIRGKVHSEINKTEDDNTTVKALHTSEKFIERKLINFKRNSNYRNIKKHNKLENKISKIETKQTLNSLKVQFQDDKQAYKQSVKQAAKKRNQKNKYKKMMMKKVNKVKFARRFQNTISNILAFKSNPLTYLLSFKGLLISIALFFVMILFYLIVMTFSNNQGIGNIYEIQKAELYYRELEATNEYNTGTRINHDPIDLASFLTTLFGEFEFNEEMETFLKDEVFSKQQQGKSLMQIISDFLTIEEYEYYLQLYDIKCGFIKYGSPFEIEYENKITFYIGHRINPTSSETKLQLHKGLDIGMAGGTPILAISDGVVTRANFSTSYGNIVEILHDDGYTSKYAHQERLNVTKGQRIKQGDIIGFVGTTGDSTGNHLHLELYDELGEFMNPIYFIARDNERNDDNSN